MTTRDLTLLTENEINSIVFEGAGCSEPRGLRDRLTDTEILDLPNHPAWTEWTTSWQDWIWNAIDTITTEDK